MKLVFIFKLGLRNISKRITSFIFLNFDTPSQHALAHIVLLNILPFIKPNLSAQQNHLALTLSLQFFSLVLFCLYFFFCAFLSSIIFKFSAFFTVLITLCYYFISLQHTLYHTFCFIYYFHYPMLIIGIFYCLKITIRYYFILLF